MAGSTTSAKKLSKLKKCEKKVKEATYKLPPVLQVALDAYAKQLERRLLGEKSEDSEEEDTDGLDIDIDLEEEEEEEERSVRKRRPPTKKAKSVLSSGEEPRRRMKTKILT